MSPPRTWIISETQDRVFLIGGVVASVLFTVGMIVIGVPEVWWWIWIVALDGPHVFATLARTYLDPLERQARPRLLWGSLLWLLVGPSTLLASLALGTSLPTVVFLTLASLWAYWHVVRQHLGFMALYKRAAGESNPGDDRWDRAALYVGTIAPFLAFALGHPEARPMLGLSGEPTWEPWVQLLAWGVAGVVVAGWAVRMGFARSAARPVSGGKILYLSVLFAWTAILFSPWVVNRLPLIGVTVAVTVWHNIQYHALVWFYKQNRYKADRSAHGLAGRLGGHFALYALAGVLFTLSYRLVACFGFGSAPGCTSSPEPILAGMSLGTVGAAVIWGVALHHYFVDQYIWRPGRDGRLRAELQVQP